MYAYRSAKRPGRNTAEQLLDSAVEPEPEWLTRILAVATAGVIPDQRAARTPAGIVSTPSFG